MKKLIFLFCFALNSGQIDFLSSRRHPELVSGSRSRIKVRDDSETLPSLEGEAMKISKVVIPAAGLGTRFLPITKSIPKEMLPILEKPAIHYIIQEAFNADLNNVFIIQNSSKTAISNYLDFSAHLDMYLNSDKKKLISELEILRKAMNFAFINQAELLGLGHAVYMAQSCISNEYFGVILPDMLFFGESIKELAEIAKKYNCSVIGVIEVPHDKVSSYGIISVKNQIDNRTFEIEDLIEKPKIEDAKSDLAISGRYILSSKIFGSLQRIPKGAGGEYQLTDAILDLLKSGERVIAYKMDTRVFDIGTPLGWIKANLEVSLKNSEYAREIEMQFNISKNIYKESNL